MSFVFSFVAGNDNSYLTRGCADEDDECESPEHSLTTGWVNVLLPTSRGDPGHGTEPSAPCLFLSRATAMRHAAQFLPGARDQLLPGLSARRWGLARGA